MFDLLKLLCLIFLMILSIVMYIKGIKKIKENNYNSLLFALLPRVITKILFVEATFEKKYGRIPLNVRIRNEKQLNLQLDELDKKTEKNINMQIIFYTFWYFLLWWVIIYLIFNTLSIYYQIFLNISIIFSRFCLLILFIIIILIFYILWKDK